MLTTGLHLMKTGTIETSLPALLDSAPTWTKDALQAKARHEKLLAHDAGLPAREVLRADIDHLVAALEEGCSTKET